MTPKAATSNFLIAVLCHFLAFFGIRLPITVEFSELFQAELLG